MWFPHINVFYLLVLDMCFIWHMLHTWYGTTHHLKVICTGFIPDCFNHQIFNGVPFVCSSYFILFFPNLFLNCCTEILFLPLAPNIFMTSMECVFVTPLKVNSYQHVWFSSCYSPLQQGSWEKMSWFFWFPSWCLGCNHDEVVSLCSCKLLDLHTSMIY